LLGVTMSPVTHTLVLWALSRTRSLTVYVSHNSAWGVSVCTLYARPRPHHVVRQRGLLLGIEPPKVHLLAVLPYVRLPPVWSSI